MKIMKIIYINIQLDEKSIDANIKVYLVIEGIMINFKLKKLLLD